MSEMIYDAESRGNNDLRGDLKSRDRDVPGRSSAICTNVLLRAVRTFPRETLREPA